MNRPEVARKHYLQIIEEHYKMAAEKGGLNRGQTEAVTVKMSRKDSQEEKSPSIPNWLENIDLRAISNPCELMQVLVKKELIPPRGLEQNNITTGFTDSYVNPQYGMWPESGTDCVKTTSISPELHEIISHWDNLPEHIKDSIMALVKTVKHL